MDPPFTPAAPPPSGVTPNYTNPESISGQSLAVLLTISAVTVLVVVVRIFTKLHVMGSFNYEDYVLVLALIFSLVYNFLCCAPESRYGYHIWEMPLEKIPAFLYFVNLDSIFWHCGILFAKWSLLIQLQRVFAVKRFSAIWWTVRVLISITTAAYITSMFVVIFICIPREKIWNPTIEGTCRDENADFLATAAINCALNCAILAVPILGLRLLNISRRKKIVIGIMFSANLLALGCSIARIVVTVKLLHSIDQTHDLLPEAYWGAAEIAFIIIATAFPTMPRFWQWCRGRDPATEAGTALQQEGRTLERKASEATVVGAVDPAWPLSNHTAKSGDANEMPPDLPPRARTPAGSERGIDRVETQGTEGGILRTVEIEVRSMV